MVATCSHWIWSSIHETPVIARSDRLERLTSSLPEDEPAPSLILMIGCRQRPPTRHGPRRRPGRVCLDLYNNREAPLLLGTTTLHERSAIQTQCCRSARENYPSTCTSPAQADAIMYSQLLHPFADVFCFYAYGPEDLEIMARHMISWVRTGPPSSRPGYPPRALIVLAGCRWKRRDVERAAPTFDGFVGGAAAPAWDAYFPEVSFLRLRHPRRFGAILPSLNLHAQAVRQERQRARALFSMRHFNALFNRAFDGVGSSPDFSFDCLWAARQDLPVAPQMASHLVNFTSLVPSAGRLRDFAAPVIASSILLDQYPPEMHLFPPAEVFHKLYRAICRQVGEAAGERDSEDGVPALGLFSHYVLANMEAFFTQLVQGRTASSVHQSVLARYAEEWRTIRSSRSCFTCFASTPQYLLSCEHSICEYCVRIFGRSESHDPWLFHLRACTLCQAPADLIVRVRPPTAGDTIVCIDGGGVRGVIPALVLKRIEDCLDLPIPVQEHFSFAYGVSVGGLVVLGLYDRGWSAATCARKLESLAAEAFCNPAPRLLVNLFIFLKWIHLLFLGCLYSPRGIETALKGVFGDKKMASLSYATTVGTKVGILTASVKQPSTHLFTNYNGIGDARVGYIIPRDCDAVKTWEVARSTSAAPMFFPPKYIPGLGTFQDGGVLRNNPTIVGLSEFSALTEDARPDLIINLGTGSEPEPEEAWNERRLRFWRDGWLARLARAYMSLMQGRSTWNDAACLVKRESRHIGHYRLDIALEGEIGLDDVSSMSMLRSMVLRDTTLGETIEEIAQRLFAALFYFELTALPVPADSRFRIEGQILCTRKAGDSALPRISQRLGSSALFIDKKAMRFQVEYDVHGNIIVPLVFFADQSFSLEIKQDSSSSPFPFSGSPYNNPALVLRGGLAASFGTRSHKRRRADSESQGRSCRRRRLF